MGNNIEKAYQELLQKIEILDADGLIKLVQEISKISDKEYKDISFCMFLIFWTELTLKKVLKKLMLSSQKPEKQYPELIDLIFDETTFMSKIKIMEFIIGKNPQYKKNFKDFFSFCKLLNNDIRNQIFHAKIKNIKYNNSPISELQAQKKILKDLIKARLKMGINLK